MAAKKVRAGQSRTARKPAAQTNLRAQTIRDARAALKKLNPRLDLSEKKDAASVAGKSERENEARAIVTELRALVHRALELTGGEGSASTFLAWWAPGAAALPMLAERGPLAK